jgi:DNA-binding transcriptional LysR family regulator
VSLSRIDLNLLVVLDTVLSERSVVRAAERLHVTPSAVSNSLARLRSVLGDPLVIRSGRGIVPTPHAASLAPSLKRALSDLESVVTKDAFDPLTTTRQFTLALADVSQTARFPELVKLVAKEMPRAQLRAVGIDTYVSSGGLSSMEIDAALIAQDKAAGFNMMPLYKENSVLAGRRGNRFAGGRMTRAQLATLRHVDIQIAPGVGYSRLAQTYMQLGIERKIAVTVPSFIAAAAVVANTDLVATIPDSLMESLGERFALRVIAGPAPKMVTPINLVWHERTNNDPAMRAFRELVIRAVAKSVRKSVTQKFGGR